MFHVSYKIIAKRKAFDINEKVSILNNVDIDMKKEDVASKHGLPASSLSTLLQNCKSILEQYKADIRDRKEIRPCKYNKINEAVLEWVKLICDKNQPVSGPFIKKKQRLQKKKLRRTFVII